MTTTLSRKDEAARIRDLLGLLEQLRCIDSTVFIEVDARTFESFSGPAELVTNDAGHPDFRSKRVLSAPSESCAPGSSVEVVLWTESHRHLRVVA